MKTNSCLATVQTDDPSVQFVIDHPRCCLFLRPGYGKTRIVIDAFLNLYISDKVKRILVVAPKLTALTTWPYELTEVKGIPCNSIVGNLKHRKEAMEKTKDFLFSVVNIDVVSWMCKEYGDRLFTEIFDSIVIDESSKFKAPNTKRFRTLVKRVDKAKRVVAMSGTPQSENIMNIWSQMRLVDRGNRLGDSFYKFRSRYFYQYNRFNWQPFRDSVKTITKRVSDICYTVHDPSIKQVPERKVNHYRVLDAKTQQVYDRVKSDFVYEFQSGGILNSTNIGVNLNKLLQICSGSVYVKTGIWDGDIGTQVVHRGKIEFLKRLVSELNRRLIIVYNFRFELADLQKEFPEAKLINDQTINDWNAGRLNMLLLHPLSAGHGINLQHGGSTIIWYGLTWSLENYLQTNARITRRGQKATETEVHHILTKGTVEEVIVRKLKNKETSQESFLEAILEAMTQ